MQSLKGQLAAEQEVATRLKEELNHESHQLALLDANNEEIAARLAELESEEQARFQSMLLKVAYCHVKSGKTEVFYVREGYIDEWPAE